MCKNNIKYQYLCKTKDGEFFVTTEKCISKEDAEQYVGDGKVIRPIIEDNENVDHIFTTSGGTVRPHIISQSIENLK